MSNSASGSKADTMFKLVLIFFISLLSFSVGTYVGKQVSDSDYRRASLEADFNGQSQVATADAAAATDPATKPITDQQTQSLSEEFIKAQQRKPASVDGQAAADATASAPAANGAAGTTKAADSKADASDSLDGYAPQGRHTASITAASDQAAAAADRVAHNMAPTKDIKAPLHPMKTLPAVATSAIGKYTVQIASYATEKEARMRAAALTKKGYSAFYVPAVVHGHKWFRVSIGLFSDQKGAVDYRTELLATKAVPSAIVQKIVR